MSTYIKSAVTSFFFPEWDDYSFRAFLGISLRFILIIWVFIAFLLVALSPLLFLMWLTS